MASLAEGSYWERIHRSKLARQGKRPVRPLYYRSWPAHLIRPYSDYLFWDVLLPRFLPCDPGLKAVELGSAPGYNLVRLHDRFGYSPYGIEHSYAGAELNRRVFAAQGLPPANVIQADVLSPDLQARFKGHFDLVFSAGLIEHFDDPKSVVQVHLALLRPGGYLVVSIPNLSGLNWHVQSALNRHVLAKHNTTIMDLMRFCGLFDPAVVRTLFCGYLGTVNFHLFLAGNRIIPKIILGALKALQVCLNPLLRVLLGARGYETALISPYLVFVGRRLG